ncbi:MAG TPA: GH32 C-terminal domain-containing protein, partial [Chloroflexaceae bacterium]|nr:GH32 C-terminal domain-containing protein [Chloroflexaceae bacterium]
VVGVQSGAPAGGSGTQYFVGDFDGAVFTCDDPPGAVRWADYGADFYAAQAWGDAPGGRALWVAWMSNWDYARDTPAATWRGTMTMPRELGLVRDEGGLALVQRPVRELAARRGEPRAYGALTLGQGALPLDPAPGETFELAVAFRAAGASASRFGLHLRAGPGGATTLAYDAGRGTLALDRAAAGQGLAGFGAPQVAPLAPRDGLLRLHVVVDTASVEVFADGGRVCLTSQIFPAPGSGGLALFAEGGAASVEELTVWPLG